ncbi:MAG: hypothetical protein MI749_00335, partial [Desulfovibrionales bacterium]|nr:hypothetical protein [Desulfovibrionales bacterium]
MTRVLKSIALLVFLFLSPLAQATETRLHVTSTQLAQDMSYLLVNYSEPIYGGDGLETAVDPDEYEYFIHPRDAVPNFRISSITMADGSPIQPGTQTVKLNLDFGEYDARRPFWLVVFSLGMEMVDAQLNRPDKGFYKVVEYAPPVLPLLGEDGNVEIHVSPQGSDQNLGSETQPVSNFDQVFELIREHINLSDVNDIKVIFRGGRYELSETIVLDSSLSPDRGKLIFTNYPGETPVFSGGRLLTDLSITEENGIWAIPVPALEEFRQLYTTGTHEKAIRAREPDEGFARVQSWDGTAKTLTVNNTALDFGTTAIQGAE